MTNEAQADETITISLAEYKSLVRDQEELRCLHIGGVDNWEWYGDSLRDGGFYADEEEDD